MHWMLWVLVALVVVLVIDRLAVFAEQRGWIFWRHRTPSGSGGSGMLDSLSEAFHPAQEYVVEQAQYESIRVDEAEPGQMPN